MANGIPNIVCVAHMHRLYIAWTVRLVFLLHSTILGVCKDCDSYNYSNYKTDLNKDILIEQSCASYFSGEKLGFHSQTHYCDFVYHYPIVLLFINIIVHHFTLFKNNSRTILGISRIVLYALNFLLF